MTLATDREGVIGEIREALVEWRRLAIAQALMQDTLRRYELERQPAVLTRTGASFSRIAEGRYTQLVTRENGIDVLGADGSRLDAALLSRGTAEQLYLCLRLALAAEFGRLAVPLPLVMDDVLVNFDPKRHGFRRRCCSTRRPSTRCCCSHAIRRPLMCSSPSNRT